ncbi:MAG TPA: cyclodeaminase [Geminicoccaceae bacterium]|nr:cyclodeaminase [Geminicoccaceae bacterium]
MPEITILSERELASCVRLDADAVVCIEDCFRTLATGQVAMPPIMRLDIPEHHGEVDVKTAYLPGVPSFAIKISPGFFDNPSLGLPSVNGLMLLLSATTGLVEAVLLDNGYLTNVRTAAAGAVAAKWLARRDARVAGIVGAGVQARLQIEALQLVREIERALVWARDPAKAREFAETVGKQLGLRIDVAPSPEQLVRQSDIVVTATPSTTPLIQADWLQPGQHITAMGSDAEHKNELAPEVVASTRYVCDRRSQCAVLGELHHAIAAGAVPPDTRSAELGEVIAGRLPGRGSEREITVCDLTGTGAQDTAIATLAAARARARGAGTVFQT